MICPLHGVILKNSISELIEKYTLWASYTPEIKSALIAYASIYGGTQNCAEILASKLAQEGIKNIKMFDVSMTHHSYILAEAFKHSHIILASPTYNNGIFVKMEQFINDLVSHNLQNRTFALIENGSWACNCADNMKKALENLKGANYIESKITIKSTLKLNQEDELENIAKLIAQDIKKEG